MALILVLLYFTAASYGLPCLLPNGYDDVLRAKRFNPEQQLSGNTILLDSNATLTPYACHNWRISPQVIFQSVCTANNWGDNASRPYLMVEFWRFMDKEKNVTDMDFLKLVTTAVPASLVDKGNTTAIANKLQTDVNAIDYGRAYHRVLLEAVSDNVPNQGWDIFISNLDTRVVPKYRLRISCIARNIPRNKYVPCPDPLGTGACSGRGKCVPDVTPTAKGAVPLSYCNCSRGWGDYGCHRPVAPLASASVSIPAGTWLYYSVEVGVANMTNTTKSFEVLAALQQRVVKHTWDVILCMKPYHGDPDRGYDRNVPALPDLTKYCDLSSYFLFKLQSFMVFSRAAVTDSKYYVAIYHRNFGRDAHAAVLNLVKRIARPSPTPALVSISSQVVELNSDTLPDPNFVCPFNCNSQGTCQEVESDSGSTRSPAHPLPFKCACGNGHGDTLCDAVQLVAVLQPGELNHVQKFDVPPNGWVSVVVQIPDPKAVVHLQDIQVGFTAPCCSAGYLRVDPPDNTPYQDPLLSTNTYPPRPLDRTFLTNVTYITNAYLPFSSLPQYWKMPGFREGIVEANDGILGTVTVYNDAFYDPVKAAVMHAQLTFYMNIVSNQSQLIKEAPFIPPSNQNSGKYNQYEVVVISVSCSAVFVGVALFMYNRIMWRQRLAHRQRQAVIRTREVSAFRNPRLLHEAEPPQGTPKEVIDSLPCVKYKRPNKVRSRRSRELMDMLATDVEDKWEGSSIARDDSDMCLVCLDLFRNNETVRQLPCTHQFHKQCIDTWLAAHTTCPTCRDDVLEPRCMFRGEEEIPLVALDSVGRRAGTPVQTSSLTDTHDALTGDHSEGHTTEEDILDALSLVSRDPSGNSELLDRQHTASSPLSSILVSTIDTNVHDEVVGPDHTRNTLSGRLRLTGRWLEQFTGSGSLPSAGPSGSIAGSEDGHRHAHPSRPRSATPTVSSRRFLPASLSPGHSHPRPATASNHSIKHVSHDAATQTAAERRHSAQAIQNQAANHHEASIGESVGASAHSSSGSRQGTGSVTSASPFAVVKRKSSGTTTPGRAGLAADVSPTSRQTLGHPNGHSNHQPNESPEIRTPQRSGGGHGHGHERRGSVDRVTSTGDVRFGAIHRGSGGSSHHRHHNHHQTQGVNTGQTNTNETANDARHPSVH